MIENKLDCNTLTTYTIGKAYTDARTIHTAGADLVQCFKHESHEMQGMFTCDVDAQLAAAHAPWSDAAGVPRRQVRLLQGLQGGDFLLPCLKVVPANT